MQAEKVEIEAIELTSSSSKAKKEYEKIIKKERNRQLNMKAQNLIKMGCFEQKEVTKIDFAILEKVTYDKLYKRVFDLYMNADGDLFYICPKTEGESNRPYAYDVIYIESLSDEEYKSLYKASSYEGASFVKFLYRFSFVALIITLLVTLSIFIYLVVSGSSIVDVITTLVQYFFYLGILSGVTSIANISYRKFIGK